MAFRNGPASAGSCMAATETSPSTLDPMCGKMRGHSDMPHPHRIAVNFGRITRMPVLDRSRRVAQLFSCNPVHQPPTVLMGGSSRLKTSLSPRALDAKSVAVCFWTSICCLPKSRRIGC